MIAPHASPAPSISPVLLGNSFPLSLVRRAVRIELRTLAELRDQVACRGLVSFWGHDNTREAAKHILGFDPAPARERPAIFLSAERLPCLDGVAFDEVWVLSPDYADGFRPKIGVEVLQKQIMGWQVLLIQFTNNRP